MEKENKKLREAGREEYNEAVSKLVAFVRKRDPRYKAHMAAVEEAQEQVAKLAKEKREKEKEQARERASDFVEQDWCRVDQDEMDEVMLYYDDYP